MKVRRRRKKTTMSIWMVMFWKTTATGTDLVVKKKKISKRTIGYTPKENI
jgi:hypothetical protein